MKKATAIVFAIITCAIHANDVLDVNGKFSNPIKNIPEKWIMNKALYENIKVLKEASSNTVELTSKLKQIHIYSKLREPVVAGDKIKISAKIKGSGKAILGLYLYGDTGKWIGRNMLQKVNAEAEWKQEQFTLELKNFKEKKLGNIRVIFGVGKDSSISFKNLQAEKVSASLPTSTNPPAKENVNKEENAQKADNSIKLTLPNEFYGVTGIESGIYLDNIILTQTPNIYTLNIKPKIGKIENNYWSITPMKKEEGEHPLNISITTQDQKVTAQGNITLNVAPKTAGKGKKLTLLIIGDSLTAASQYSRELARLLSEKGNPKWTMIGTQKKGNGVAHEGYGGWTWKSFITKYVDKPVKRPNRGLSPFIFLDQQGKQKLNFERYFKEKCNGKTPNVITVLLGINDCFGLQKRLNTPGAVDKGIDNVFKNAAELLKELRKGAPNAIIGICLTPPPNTREKAFFANYKGKYHRWTWKQVQHRLVQRQIKHFENREKENVYIIPTELNIDCINGYPKNNGVHPNKKGYNQIGTSIYCWLKWQLYQNPILKSQL